MKPPDRFFAVIQSRFGGRSRERVRHQMNLMYQQINFEGATVLDIGGGIGLHSFYASSRGARSVTVIEPEADGGHDRMIETFEALRADMGLGNVELIRTRFQDYVALGQSFDVVMIQDAINHFDEDACITLRTSAQSRQSYERIFEEISALVAPGGRLVLSDCSSRNLYPLLGRKNPFDPQIEWHKHQPPFVWADLGQKHGLNKSALRWSSPARFGAWGKAIFGNALGAWFFTSHFVLEMVKG